MKSKRAFILGGASPSKPPIFVKVKPFIQIKGEQLRGVVPLFDAQVTVIFDDEIGTVQVKMGSRFETKTDKKASLSRGRIA